MRQRFIQSFPTSQDIQSALDNKELGKPYVALSREEPSIDWNSKEIDYTGMPLTIEVLETGVFNINDGAGKYSINGGEWKTYTNAAERSISVNAGDKVRIVSTTGYGTYAFRGNTIAFNVFGNIMSMVYGENFADQTILKDSILVGAFSDCTGLVNAENLILPALSFTTSANYPYREMFKGCTNLIKGPKLLPATALVKNCYERMFQDCTSLATAPELPATELANNCYSLMFAGCTSLTTAPELPATTLARACYSSMFWNCTSLTTAPELPATELAEACYSSMFQGCTSLTTAPVLNAISVPDQSYRSMFYGCTSLATAPELPATILGVLSYGDMFSNCTSLTQAPELPESTNVDVFTKGSYQGMFSYCSNLRSIKCLATSIGKYNFNNWVNGVASTGTFVKHPDATWPTGTSGIPNGWTVENAEI